MLYHTIIVHSSRTLQSSLLLQSPDTEKMGTFLANAPSSTVEESLQQTLIARLGLPHNALHSLVYQEIEHLNYTVELRVLAAGLEVQ